MSQITPETWLYLRLREEYRAGRLGTYWEQSYKLIQIFDCVDEIEREMKEKRGSK